MNFLQFIFFRAMSLVIQIFGVVAFLFALLAVIPYDPTVIFLFSYRGPNRDQRLAELRRDLGIDVPIYQQYYNFFHRLIMEKSLGVSWTNDKEVLELYSQALRYTFLVFGTAFLIYTPLAITLGLLSAKYHRSAFDNSVRLITTAAYSFPPFVLGIWIIILSGYHEYSYFPIPPPTGIIDILKYSIFPIITVILIYTSFQYRLVRSNILKILKENYIRTARAKGLSEQKVLFKHALRNALPFLITSIAVTFPIAFSGVAILEVVFDIPGSGYLLVRSASAFDWPVLIGGTVIYTFISAIILALADAAIYLLSPKERFHYSSNFHIKR